ncbi:unnamed protein product [Urochloa humidicola]
MAPPPPLPELMDELVGEILLRLPPDEPEHLFRAALVCKPWLRVLCDPASAAATAPSTGRRPCSASSTGSSSREKIRSTASPPPRWLPFLPSPTAATPSTAATAASSSRRMIQIGVSSFGTPSLESSSACRSQRASRGGRTPERCSAPPPAATTSTATAALSASYS